MRQLLPQNPAMDRPTKEELLEQLRRTFHQAQPFVSISAVQIELGDTSKVPPEVLEGLLAEIRAVGVDKGGWSVAAEREWAFAQPQAVRVQISRGVPLEAVLARLDRIRAELVARPELLEPDWSSPLPRRPALRVVKDPK